MEIIKSRLNIFLMALLVIVLIGLIGLSLYFQSAIKDVNDENRFLEKKLELTEEDLRFQVQRLTELNSSYKELNVDLENYTSEFDEIYGSCTEQKQQLSSILNSTRKDLESQKERYLEKLDEVSQANDIIESVMLNISISRDRLENMDSKFVSIISSAEDIIDEADSRDSYDLDECKAALSDSENDADDIKDVSTGAKSDSGLIYTKVSALEASLEKAMDILE